MGSRDRADQLEPVFWINRNLSEPLDDLDCVVDARLSAELRAPALEPAQAPEIEQLRARSGDQREKANRDVEIERPRMFVGERPRERDREVQLTAIEVRFQLPYGTVGSRHTNTCSHTPAASAQARRGGPILAGVCGRYTNTAGPEELNERFRIPIRTDAGTRRFNIAPTEDVLAIVSPRGEPEARLLRWGLVPHWASDLKGSAKMINARIETVASRPAYRNLIPKSSRRALQIADGYFEWIKPEKRSEPRQPFYFRVDGGLPFAFASLWTPAKIDGSWIESVTLLTCDSAPNRTAAAIHGRMPVILADEEAQRAWLDPALGAEEALALCGALPAERLSAQAANPAVNKVIDTVEGPELLVAPT